ncbi:hypothetical protein [Actinocorallia aurantiaca]|uniref:hypothetical protein n=1 Tax=Actinocorallia aurantiaca TaxID=46204 RepID=UPI0031D93D82
MRVWSPTNRTTPDIDHQAFTGLDVLWLECKGLTDTYEVPIGMSQLARYAKSYSCDVWYVIPSPPPASPDKIDCDCAGGTTCLSCPIDTRTYVNPIPLSIAQQGIALPSSAIPLLFGQPWFAHWTSVISAKSLHQQTLIHGRRNFTIAPDPDQRLSTEGLSINGAERLCHFLNLRSTPQSPWKPAPRVLFEALPLQPEQSYDREREQLRASMRESGTSEPRPVPLSPNSIFALLPSEPF